MSPQLLLRRASASRPSGNWNDDDFDVLELHEIKHDGFRVIARKDGNRIRLYSRPCNDLANAPRRLPPASSTRLRGVMTRKASCVR
jgi:hypothetical protein